MTPTTGTDLHLDTPGTDRCYCVCLGTDADGNVAFVAVDGYPDTVRTWKTIAGARAALALVRREYNPGGKGRVWPDAHINLLRFEGDEFSAWTIEDDD